MDKETPKVIVKDQQSGQVLFECTLAEAEKAYAFVAEMEELGLDLKVVSPTLAQTLSHSLGLSADAQDAYEKSLDEELEGHDGSCCFEDLPKE